MDGEAMAMNTKQDNFTYAGICVAMILLSGAGLVYGFVGQLILAPDAPFTLDGILLALVCLSMGGLFTLMLAVHAVKVGWIRLPSKEAGDGAAAGEAK